jgi:medium-chain acyl-[acyl-carrier-protein] hydrolase
MGALIGFELARALRQHAGPFPVHLFVSSYHAPQRAAPNPAIHAWPNAEFIEALQQLNGTSAEVLENPELMELMLPVLRADFALCETYTYRAEKPLACPISAFGGVHDGAIKPDDLEAWQEQTSGGFSLRLFPGDHFYIQRTCAVLIQTVLRDLGPAVERSRYGPVALIWPRTVEARARGVG